MNVFVPVFHSNSECPNTLDLRQFINYLHYTAVILFIVVADED